VPAEALTSRQRDVLTAARDLLTREGVEALTLGRVAKALEIRPPSLYKHFAGKREIEAALIAEGFAAFADGLERAGPDLRAFARAYRAFALARPHPSRRMTEGPLQRDLLPAGLEDRAAAPLLRAVGDPDRARAVWAFAHGMVQLELAGRFPPGADLDAAWAEAIGAFTR
jgi:AcrR family transcriptional regulator